MSDTIEQATTIERPEYLPDNLWQFYEKALAREDVSKMLHDGHPHQGYYRDGTRAVHFFFDPTDWALCCVVDGSEVQGAAFYTDVGAGKAYVGDTPDMRKYVARWVHLAKRPVIVGDYEAKVKTGHWPGENEAVTRSNNAPADDSFEGIMADIQEMAHEAERLMKLGPAKTQVQANEASDVADKLAKLYAKADNARKIEKQPHLDAEREVDDKWRPLTTAASVYKRLKDAVVEPFLKAQKRAKEEAERKAREEADRARREAAEREAAAQRAADEAARQGNAAAAAAAKKLQDEADAARARAETAEATSMTIAATPVTAGTRGRKTHLTTRTEIEFTDYDAAVQQLKARPKVMEVIESEALILVKAGVEVAGVKVKKTPDAA